MMSDEEKGESMGEVIRIDAGRIRDHLGEMVRGTVEEALNAMLDAEAEALCGASRYERTEGRRDYRTGHYTRRLQTKAGEVNLQVAKLRRLPFEAAIMEPYRRRGSSVEEALIEMSLVESPATSDISAAKPCAGRRPPEYSFTPLLPSVHPDMTRCLQEWAHARQDPREGRLAFPYVMYGLTCSGSCRARSFTRTVSDTGLD